MAGSGELLGEEIVAAQPEQPKPELRVFHPSVELLDPQTAAAIGRVVVPIAPPAREHVHSNLTPAEIAEQRLQAAQHTECTGAALAAKFSAAGFEDRAAGIRDRAATRAHSLRTGL